MFILLAYQNFILRQIFSTINKFIQHLTETYDYYNNFSISCELYSKILETWAQDAANSWKIPVINL